MATVLAAAITPLREGGGALDDDAFAPYAEFLADAGVDGVGVIPPPYYPLDARALVGHFRAAAEACAPCPFYLYEFQARAGYVIPLEVIDELRATLPNLAGLKVSDTPFAAV